MKKQEEFVTTCGGIQPEKLVDKADNKITEVVFILDASGSMHGLEKDTIGGVNSILKEQKETQGDDTVYVSTVIFDNYSKVIHDRVDIAKVELLTEKDYYVRGCTALYDAVGGAIHHISNIHKYARAEDVPGKTTFIIMTDGMENASKTYNQSSVKSMIKEKQEQGWEFVFLAANIDASEAAGDLGIARERAVDWHADKEGVQVVYECLSAHVQNARSRKKYSRNVFANADKDFEKRKK